MNEIGVSFLSCDILSRKKIREDIFIEISDFAMPDRIADGHEILKSVTEKINIRCIQAPIRDWKTEAMDENFRQLTLKKTKEHIDLASENNVERIIFFSSYDQLVKLISYDEMWLNNNIRFWKEVAEYAEKKNVICMYCNVWDCKPDLMRNLFDAVNSDYFKFAFDIGHAFYAGKEPAEVWIDKLHSYIDYVCVHDNNGDFDAHLQIGQGKIKIRETIEYIRKYRDDLLYCLQFFDNNGFEHSLLLMNEYVRLKWRK